METHLPTSEQTKLTNALRDVFGHKDYRNEMQKNAIECAFKGINDILVLFPTGGGKSLVYQLPGIIKDGICVVISPLISLIQDQVSNLRKKNINAIFLDSNTSPQIRQQILDRFICVKTRVITNTHMKIKSPKPSQIFTLLDICKKNHPPQTTNNKKISYDDNLLETLKFLYITPEMASTKSMSEYLVYLSEINLLNYFVIDEAHCISNWGHEFRPSYLNLGILRNKLHNCCCIAVTATATTKIKNDIITLLHMRNVERFQMSCFRSNLFYDVKLVELLSDKSQMDDVIEFIDLITKLTPHVSSNLNNNNDHISGIVYCRTKDLCDEIADNLCINGLKASPYHSNMSTKTRSEIQQSWITNQINIIVATISFGMGVDKPDVRFVIHWNMSKSIEAYCQETGRAGRDGKNSYCRLYYSKYDRDSMLSLVKQSQLQKQQKPSFTNKMYIDSIMDSFVTMISYVETPSCRHLLISKFFNEKLNKCKNQCDYCVSKSYVEESLEYWDLYHRDGLLSVNRHNLSYNPIEIFLKQDRLKIEINNSIADKTDDNEAIPQFKKILEQIINRPQLCSKIGQSKSSQIVNCFMLIAMGKTRQFIPDLTVDTRMKNVTVLKWNLKKRLKNKEFSMMGCNSLIDDPNIIANHQYECWFLGEYLAMKYSSCLKDYKINISNLSKLITNCVRNGDKSKLDKSSNDSATTNIDNKTDRHIHTPTSILGFSTAFQLMNKNDKMNKFKK